jgi:hypothetical protein
VHTTDTPAALDELIAVVDELGLDAPERSDCYSQVTRERRRCIAHRRSSANYLGAVEFERFLLGLGVLVLALWMLWMSVFGKRRYQFPYEERTPKEFEKYGWSGGWRPVQRYERIVGTAAGVLLIGVAVAVFLSR